MSVAVARRRALLSAALDFVQLPPQTSALRALHAWLDTWTGLGAVVVGMVRLGYRVSLTRLDDHWRSRFGHPRAAPAPRSHPEWSVLRR